MTGIGSHLSSYFPVALQMGSGIYGEVQPGVPELARSKQTSPPQPSSQILFHFFPPQPTHFQKNNRKLEAQFRIKNLCEAPGHLL